MKNKLNLLSFGEALKALHQGLRVQRKGWNGEDLFVFKQVPATISVEHVVPKMQSLPRTVKHVFIERSKGNDIIEGAPIELFENINYKDQLAFVNPVNGISGYIPSGSDCLNNDWIILDSEDAEVEFSVPRQRKGCTDFGSAVELMKKGHTFRREGWNGENMFLYIVPATQYKSITRPARDFFGEYTPYRAYFALKTEQNDIAAWSPTSADALANDWVKIS